MNNLSFKLRLKLLLSLVLLLLMMVSVAVFQLRVLTQTEVNHRLLGELSKLEELSKVLPRRSQNYVNNAARDFESYQRDVQVFFVDILADIEQVDTLVNDLTTDFDSKIAYALPESVQGLFGAESVMMLSDSAMQAQGSWQSFQSGLQEKLGENKQEPRIEWGAEFIINNADDLQSSFNTMIDQYRDFLKAQSDISQRVLEYTLVFIALYILAIIVWVYLSVFRRIGKTVTACHEVAKGNFGYTMNIEGDDELSILARSFNLLSNRSRLILAMLGDLQQARSNDEALQTIIQASGGYLPIAWAGLIRINSAGDGQLLSALPGKGLTSIQSTFVTNEQNFHTRLNDALVNKKAFRMDQLVSYAGTHADEQFLRSLVKTTNLESLLVAPLVSLNGWEGVLVFGSRSGEYRDDHAELMENLASLLASTFERF